MLFRSLDEPTQGLDPQSIVEFLSLIASLRESEGMTFLLSSHQLDEIQSVCDRVGLFSRGKLISFGTVAELGRLHFGSDVLINLQAEGPTDLLPLLKTQQGVLSVEREEEHTYLIKAEKDIRPSLAQAVIGSGCNLSSLELKQHSLNDIYQLAFKEASNEQT